MNNFWAVMVMLAWGALLLLAIAFHGLASIVRDHVNEHRRAGSTRSGDVEGEPWLPFLWPRN